ncbi:hypothetical protein [Paenibacillus sp. LHD-38]|uniref:phytoene desaturase family protein n=1 Tax=Paenibacillus sp. LHD-38 TaxID=3072143 RepID=UPI00281029E1|nr:hypothetical protein [Paenibacillus sp. LHD-38]MDQ8735276.1 hypothetical protein [Paenibacillus sp. LHD-38]
MGYRFDTGPSILTMPWVLEQLFASAEKRLEDYMTLKRVEPQWRAKYEDGTALDILGDLPGMLAQIGSLSSADREHFFRYMDYCRQQYELSLKSFYSRSITGISDMRQQHSGANGGSIYGVVTDRKLNGGFKIPSRSAMIGNLYFVGGSTHPGGGVPMVTLSGQLTADLIREDLLKQAVI